MKCKCGKGMVKGKAEFMIYGISLGRFDALVCKCGRTDFGESMDAVRKALLEKDLYGLESMARVGKIGDSLAVRLPKRLACFLGLRKGYDVKLTPLSRRRLLVELPSLASEANAGNLEISRDSEQCSLHGDIRRNLQISENIRPHTKKGKDLNMS